MNILKSIFVITLLGASSMALADSGACPLGKKEDHLTIQRVMLNFGKYVQNADGIALKDVTPEQVVTDAQLQTAIAQLSLAKACADAVIANPTGDLLPATAGSLEGAKKQKLIDDLVMYMTEFSDGLNDYQQALIDVLNTTPAESRNYHAVYVNYKNLDNLVTRAHRETSFDSDPNANVTVVVKSFTTMDKENADIKNPMKQIGVDFTQIKKTVTAPANNAVNAAAAREMATLFAQVMNLIPDPIQSMPTAQRAAAVADYQKMIQEEVDLSNQLAAAFDKNDNAGAVKIVQQMNSIKMDGHDRYNP